jgi:hypothetical protein
MHKKTWERCSYILGYFVSSQELAFPTIKWSKKLIKRQKKFDIKL